MIKERIEEELNKVIAKEMPIEISAPEQEQFGHYSTNVVLRLASLEKRDPEAIAKEIIGKFNLSFKSLFQKIEFANPGFINFWLSEKILEEELKNILRLKNNYGRSEIGKDKTIVVDYSAPNIAKPMTVGHLRSTIIGEVLVNLYRFLGYRVIGDNHIGDWGTQFGALLAAYRMWGDKKEFKKNPITHLVNLYIRFNKEAETDEKLLDAARLETKKLQDGDWGNRRLWKIFIKESLREFNKIYKRLGVKFDVVLGESFYQPILKSVIDDAVNKGAARRDDGALKIFYEDGWAPLVIQKSDGAFLYSTTDLAAIKYRMNHWKPDKILYVVANEQSFHFQQIFEAAKLLGYVSDGVLEHVKFGMVLGGGGKKMATRRGEFIKLEELLDQAVAKASEIDKEAAEAVGIGAVKYNDLSRFRQSDIIFNWKQMLNLQGDSGPYLQYTYARLRSILRKAGLPNRFNFSLLKNKAEQLVIRQLIYFPETVFYSAVHYEPSHLVSYLLSLTNLLNNFYEHSPVLKADKELRQSRLALIGASAIVLKQGLNLLAIEAPERM